MPQLVLDLLFHQAASSAGSGQSFGHNNYDLVYGIIRVSIEEHGVNTTGTTSTTR
jgi:hypothetical protein